MAGSRVQTTHTHTSSGNRSTTWGWGRAGGLGSVRLCAPAARHSARGAVVIREDSQEVVGGQPAVAGRVVRCASLAAGRRTGSRVTVSSKKGKHNQESHSHMHVRTHTLSSHSSSWGNRAALACGSVFDWCRAHSHSGRQIRTKVGEVGTGAAARHTLQWAKGKKERVRGGLGKAETRLAAPHTHARAALLVDSESASAAEPPSHKRRLLTHTHTHEHTCGSAPSWGTRGTCARACRT